MQHFVRNLNLREILPFRKGKVSDVLDSLERMQICGGRAGSAKYVVPYRKFPPPLGICFCQPSAYFVQAYTDFTFQFPHQRYKIIYIWKTMNELVPTVGLNGQKPKKGEAESV